MPKSKKISVTFPVFDKSREKQFSKYFKAFSDQSRLRIVILLANKELTVGEIVKAMDISQPTVSRHLAVLRQADIVVDRREGQKVYYSLNKKAVGGCCYGFCECLEIKIKPEKKVKK
jgi:DNA-binding transcriptional ArsR family regulator